jgi:hypothetical protein
MKKTKFTESQIGGFLQTEMTEFNLTIYYDCLLRGHRSFVYKSCNGYGVIMPAAAVGLSESEYLLTAGDMELFDMANGIDEFKIYFQDVLPQSPDRKCQGFE